MRTISILKPFSGKFTAFLLARILPVLAISFLTIWSAKSQCTISAGNDTAICLNAPFSITATTSGSGAFTNFTWNTIPAGTATSGSSFVVPTSGTGTFVYVVSADVHGGCTATDTVITDTITVTVDPLPTASFIFNPNGECGSVPIEFTNTSSGIGLSYSWVFGDPNSGAANTSSSTSPAHHFVGTPGTGTQNFTVTLIVTSSGGCKDTITQQITTKQSPGTELGGTGHVIYNGLHYFTTCSTSSSALFNFINQSSTSSTNTNYTIVWGDASPDFTATSFSSTSHTYSTGTYTLLFIVSGGAPNSCPDTATYYVFIGSNPGVGLNNPGNTAVCSGAPLTFPISGTFPNPPGTTYTVSFNDGSVPVTFIHPAPADVTHTFAVSSCGTNSSDGSNIYSNSFSAVIVASNPCGASSSGVVPIYVSQRPLPSFTISPNDTVCANRPVIFTNTSVGNSVQNGTCTPGKGVWSVSPATGWTISSGVLGNDFGFTDPTIWLSGSTNLNLNFTTPGTYTIKLKIGGSTWCNIDSIEQTICVTAVPVAAFNVNQNIGCAPFAVNTTNNSSIPNCGNNTFNWSVTYAPTAGCSPSIPGFAYINGTNAASPNPQFQFNNPGVYTISLIAIAPGGACNSPIATQQITVKEKPVVNLSPLLTICQNQSINPVVAATCYTSAATYAWTFPSGSPSTSTSQNPGPVTYNNTGTFNISVDVTNECGTTTATQPLTVITVTTANAGPAQNLCGNIITMAANAPVIGIGQWTYVSGPVGSAITNSSSPTTTITGLVPGAYVFDWTITNGICTSSSTVTITIVDGPTPAAAGPDQNLCLATSATMAANAPVIGTGQWSYVSGPLGYTITNASSPTTTITGLVPGAYIFRWTTSFANCTPSTDDALITVYANPTVADAGIDQTVCSPNTTMAANTPVIGIGQWSLIAGPNTPVITNPASSSTSITGLIPGTYIFQWTITNGVCPSSTDNVQVIVTPFPTTAAAGTDQIVCAANNITLTGNIPVIGNGTWTMISGPNTPVITSPSSPSTTVTGLIPGAYIFQWTISNGVCPPSTDNVQVTINDNVTVSNAGLDQHICGTVSTMAANAAVIGTGLWSYVSGPGGSTITNPSSPTTTITGLIPGTYIFQWTITNGSCASSSNVTIIIESGPTTANAGPDQNLCLANSTTLAGNTPSLGTSQWTYVSGPTGSAITNPALPGTIVTGLVPGTYVFRWTTSFSNCTPSTDDVQITIYANPTVADAGIDQTICSSTVTMAGNTPVIGNGTWTIISGPNTPAITSSSIAGTTITGLIPGTYTFKWTTTNGVCPPSTDDVQVIVTAVATTAAAGPDQRVCSVTSVTMAANTAVVGTGQWSLVSGPNTPTITNVASSTTTITGLTNGTYTFRWTITNGVCPPSTDDVQVIIDEAATVSVAGPGQHICGTVATMAGNTANVGSGTWTMISGPNTPVITNPSLSTTTITGLIPGTYTFRWTITNGVCSSLSDVTVIIESGPTPAAAGPDQNLCLALSTTLAANTPSLGTGQWTYVSGPTGYTITDNTLPNTTVTGLVPGVYTFRWTTTFANCSPSTDDVQVTVYDNPTTAAAGIDQTICSADAMMAGNPPVIGNGTWTMISGPNSPVITLSSSATTTITGLIPGTYIFRWTITNGVCPPSTDDVQVIVTPFPTTAAAGQDQTICNATTATLAGNTALVGIGQWTFISGPNTPTITDPALASTTVTGLIPGGYVFQWTIANGVCPSSADNVQINNLSDIQNSINSAITLICSDQSVTITGNIPTGGNASYSYQWEQSPDGTSWSIIPGATLQNYTSTLTASTCFRRKVTSLPCETYSNTICIIVQAAIANNTIAPDQNICINTIPATITGSTPTGGNGIYGYQWQQSTDGGTTWNDIIGATSIDYTPGILAAPIKYRRLVNTTLCSGPQSNVSAPVTITINQDSKALFAASTTINCAAFNLSPVINVTPFPDRNGQYQWYADGVLFGTNTTGVFPGYIINTPGDTVVIKLVTTSQFGCKPDSMQIEFITYTTVVAGFTKSPANGCGPLTVAFTNTSSILNSSTEYFWNFGNGITANTMLPPGPMTYNNSPNFKDTTYYITLKAYNGCDTTSFLDSVIVFPDSKARFGVDTTRGCSPFTIHITNTSPGNNSSYYWDFGDGTRDTTHATGPLTHTYNTGTITTYTIRLISENQCSRDTQSIDIVVSPNIIQPFVSVFGNQLSGCAPHLATFSNSSVGATQLIWNFGDNSPLITTPNTQNIITHLYNGAGNFTITIRLQNDCSDTTITRTVTVYDPPSASFDMSSLKICTGQAVTVTNTSTNANSYEWTWGDLSSPSSFTSGQHTYNTAGVYDIRLVATRVHSSGFVCTDTAIKQISVLDKIPAQINVGPGRFCAPYTLNVDAGNIAGFSNIEWIIYDSSTTQKEFHVNGLSATHLYNVAGTYSVKLIVHTASNCVDSATYQFKVSPTPTTIFDPKLITTCTHDSTIICTAVTTNNGTDPVNYKWFVNGSIEGTSNPFSHHFQVPDNNTAPVEFIIKALAENAAGCGDTSLTGKLIVQPLPLPGITVSPSFVLQQPDYKFTFKDTVATSVNKTYLWNMGDRSGQTRSGQEITYEYGDTGTYKVKLLVKDFATGCSAVDSVKVTILHVPGYLYVPNALCLGCSNNSLRQFLPLGKGLKQYRLTIYTTWGQKIFETTSLNADGSPNVPWDGRMNGKVLQQDAYSWQIEAYYTNGTEWKGMLYPQSNKYVKAGFITIIK